MRYSKAPVQEAIIDLRLTQSSHINVENILAFSERFRAEGCEVEPIVDEKIEFQTGETPSIEHAVTTKGVRIHNHNTRTVCFAEPEKFVFSLSYPYESWEVFSEQARRFWGMYLEATDVQNVTRVALRYINKFDFEADEAMEIEDYFQTYPKLSLEYEHKQIGGVFMQLELNQPDLDAVLILNQVRVEPPTANHVSIILDLDLFSRNALLTPNEAWDKLSDFRVRKNQIFNASISEKAREQIS